MVITDREFEIRFPGCSPKVSTLRALFQLVSDPLFIGYIVAVVMVFGMIDQPVQSAIGMRTSTFLTLFVGAVFYVALHFVALALSIKLTPQGKRVVHYAIIPFLLLGVPIVTLTVYAGQMIGAFILQTFPENIFTIFFRSFQVLVFEWVFHAFVFGALISRLNQIKFIEFGNNKIAQDEVVYLQALEHHVKMVTKSSEHVQRARLKDVIQILADVDGIQPHRSYWVPKQAILWAGQDAQALSLYTENHVIPVAGTRRLEIEKWLNDNQIEIRTAPLSSH